jgi:2-methylcitrate dehydratase PrpD
VVLHALIDGVLEHRERIRRAEEFVVRLHPLAIERTHRPEPRNAIEARLSAQHALAVAVLRGRAGLAEFSDAATADPEVQSLRRRVSLVSDANLDKMSAVVTAGGTTIDARASRPMDDARLKAKFESLAGARAAAWLQVIEALESLEAVRLPPADERSVQRD